MCVFVRCNLIRGALAVAYVILLADTKAGTFPRAFCTCGRWCWDGMVGRYFQGRSLNSKIGFLFFLGCSYVSPEASRYLEAHIADFVQANSAVGERNNPD